MQIWPVRMDKERIYIYIYKEHHYNVGCVNFCFKFVSTDFLLVLASHLRVKALYSHAKIWSFYTASAYNICKV